MTIHQRVIRERRVYNQWVADETLEDYALRFTADHARRWSAWRVGNTAIGAISFLACEAIGGTITLTFGFTNAMAAIAAVGTLLFLIGLPICLSATKYGVDVDLLTRGAGFGYVGSTITSLVYASFTFILFAIEASIMSDAISIGLGIPLWLTNIISALMVIPIAAYGFRAISKLQLWTQPVWLLLQFAPLIYLALRGMPEFAGWQHFTGTAGAANGAFGLLPFGMAASVLLSLTPQIGEQVDYLRFLPARSRTGSMSWWSTLILAGPGWVFIGCAKLAAGSFLAYLALSRGVAWVHATQPATLYRIAFLEVFRNPVLAAALTIIFIVTCQIKINVTNAYAGSIAWSNFFSRLTHAHPGRVVWLAFNVLLALLLMEIGIFRVIQSILGLYANVAVGWMGAVAADLVINKPLGLSPPGIEFKRAYLYDINPVGVGAMGLSIIVSTAMSFGLFGLTAHALAPFAGLLIAFIAAPAIAFATGGKYYLARRETSLPPGQTSLTCIVCTHEFERPDMAFCPAYRGAICSLCCSLDARCHDACKPHGRFSDQTTNMLRRILPLKLAAGLDGRIGQFLVVLSMFALFTGIMLILIGHEYATIDPAASAVISTTLWIVFVIFFIISGVIAWLLVLAQSSRRAAESESARQTSMLMDEIAAHERTDAALEKSKSVAESANTAKSRYIVGVIHEIRSPLNAISGYAQLLERAGTMRTADAVRVIRRSAEHLSNLVDGLMDVSKIESGSLQIYRDQINFAEFLDQIVDMFRLQATAKGLEFIYDRADHIPDYVHADEKRLRQILINLLSNAIKYTEAGAVTLRVHYRSQTAEFDIIDTGYGIRPEDLTRIFEPFERGHLAHVRAVPGTGLGLTISKLLTEILGGEISVQSQINQGSQFKVRMLLSHAPGNAQSHKAERRPIGYSGARRRILISDDDQTHIDLLHEILSPLGFVLFTTMDGQDCLDLAQAAEPDLVILDISMPGLSGFEVAERLRRQRPDDLWILIVSGNMHDAQNARQSNAAHDGFLAKPIEIRALLSLIATSLDINWLFDEPAAHSTPTRKTNHAPDPEHLINLLELGRIGYIRGIEAKLAEIVQTDPAAEDFIGQLQTMVRNFDLSRYTQTIEQALKPHDV